MANRQRDAGRERFWRKMLQRQVASGLSVRAFCRQEGVTEPSFYAWRRTIARRDAEEGGAPHAACRRRSRRGGRAFVPVVVTDPPCETGMVLELAGGRRLRLPEAMAVEQVARLVQALEAGMPAGEDAR